MTKVSAFIFSPRRAHLKVCFETLKNEIPTLEDKRTSNLNILKSALRYIQVSYMNLYGVYLIYFYMHCIERFSSVVDNKRILINNNLSR